MANKFLLKKSSVVAKVPTTSDLEYGEIALNYADEKLYFKNSSNAIKSFSVLGVATLTWTKKTTNYTAVNGDQIIADTTSGTFTITLPTSPTTGNIVTIVDGANWKTTNLTVARNGSTIEGLSEDLLIDIGGIRIDIIFDGTTWEVYTLGTAGSSPSLIKKTTNYTAVNGDQIIADTTAGAFTITLPSSPTTGNIITIVDGANWKTTNLTVARNGSTIEGLAEDLIINIGGIRIDIVFDGSTWEVYTVASSSTSLTNDITTNASYYLGMSATTSGTWDNAYVSNTKLYFNPNTGTLNASNFNSLSDITKKKNVKTISNAVDTINKLAGVEFDWKDTNKHSSGVIAQSLEQVLPFLVEENEDGMKSVNYSGLIGYLIESIKELKNEINQLKEVK
jgi:hypothetical protein